MTNSLKEWAFQEHPFYSIDVFHLPLSPISFSLTLWIYAFREEVEINVYLWYAVFKKK